MPTNIPKTLVEFAEMMFHKPYAKDAPLFWNRMTMRQVKTFRTSAMTTADVEKKLSPGNVRT